MKRAVIIFGAGASVEYGIPATVSLTNKIREKLNSDHKFKSSRVVEVYDYVKNTLTEYYKDEQQAHFERIYHVIHELNAHHLTDGAVPKFSPIMIPFLHSNHDFNKKDFSLTARAIIETIYSEASAACSSNSIDLGPLNNFFSYLEQQYIPRIYTTNYDNFVGQATQKKYFTGFTRENGNHKLFDSRSFFEAWDKACLYHLHGSIHMAYPSTPATENGELAWYEETKDALQQSSVWASGISRMDGTQFDRTPIITGMEKLGRLQQNPYAFYYSQLPKDIMEADVIFIIGSGLGDLHINKWLREVRLKQPKTPLVLVGYWNNEDFGDMTDFDISLIHDLNVMNSVRDPQEQIWNQWTLYPTNRAATWNLGFGSFLKEVDKMDELINKLNS